MKPLEKLSYDLAKLGRLMAAHPEDLDLHELQTEAALLQASVTEVLDGYKEETAMSVAEVLNGLAEQADRHEDFESFINAVVPTPMCDPELLPSFSNIRSKELRDGHLYSKRDWPRLARNLLIQSEFLHTSLSGEYVQGAELKSRYKVRGVEVFAGILRSELKGTPWMLDSAGMYHEKQFRVEKRPV